MREIYKIYLCRYDALKTMVHFGGYCLHYVGFDLSENLPTFFPHNWVNLIIHGVIYDMVGIYIIWFSVSFIESMVCL